MIETIMDVIKTAFLFICQFYIYSKLIRQKKKWYDLFEILLSIVFSVVVYYSSLNLPLLYPWFLLIFSMIYNQIRYKFSFRYTLSISCISLGLTICLMFFSMIIEVPILFIMFYYLKGTAVIDIIQAIVIGLTEILIAFGMFKIKRLNSGIEPNKNSSSYDILLLGSITCIFAMTIAYGKNIALDTIESVILLITFFAISIIIWSIRYISEKYQRAIYYRNIEILEQSQEQLISKNEQLLKQNEMLSSIIHRDNKIIPAMEITVKNLCEQNKVIVPQEILDSLQQLSAERKESIKTYQFDELSIKRTDNKMIDSVMEFLFFKAKAFNISFDIDFEIEALNSILNSFHSILELNTILCDLGENAIIATKNQENKHIKIIFNYSLEHIPQIVVFDSGTYFDNEVLKSMGKKRITTHKDDGGSGIGLMTIISIIKKYNMSFCINEQPENEIWTKSITLLFDKNSKIAVVPHDTTK